MSSDAAKHWRAFADLLGDVGDRIHGLADADRTPEQQEEVNQHMLSALGAGVLLAQMDVDYPDWIPQINNDFSYANPSPDNVYYLSKVDGAGAYRITGRRGSVTRIDLAVNHGFTGFTETATTVANLDIDQFNLAADDTFEILMGPVRPPGHTGDWVGLDPSEREIFLAVRQVSYDWKDDEVDGCLTIQRIDRPIRTRRRSAGLNGRLPKVADYVARVATTLHELMEAQYPPGGFVPNRLEDPTRTFTSQPVVRGQAYYAGEVVIDEDEALIVECEIPPECPYWNTQLADTFFNALDFMYQQPGLNSRSATVDPDGKVRIVVSQRDPGVANWLDKADYGRNMMRFRFYKCDAPPPVTTTKVAFADLAKHLHPGAVRVSPEARQAALRRRVERVQRRRRW